MGNIRDPKVAEEILVKGDADFIGIGRGLIAEPEWGKKSREGRECDLRNVSPVISDVQVTESDLINRSAVQ